MQQAVARKAHSARDDAEAPYPRSWFIEDDETVPQSRPHYTKAGRLAPRGTSWWKTPEETERAAKKKERAAKEAALPGQETDRAAKEAALARIAALEALLAQPPKR